jgi:3-hydroxybutyryl-CoA dehydrogenase
VHFYQPANLNLWLNEFVMKILVHGTDQQFYILLKKGVPEGISLIRFDEQLPTIAATAYFDLLYQGTVSPFDAVHTAPVFVNAVNAYNSDLAANFIRLNAWPGFLEGQLLEIATADSEFFKNATEMLHQLNWGFQAVPDKPGLIAPRIIAMIINEAYFGWEENISSKEDIDTAMKLGTNYPFGPFEWGALIGLDKIVDLLEKLGQEDERYQIAPALLAAAKTNH